MPDNLFLENWIEKALSVDSDKATDNTLSILGLSATVDS